MKGTFLFVTGSKNLSGADFSMFSVIKQLESKGYDCLIVLPKEGKSSAFWQKNNIHYFILPFKVWFTKRSINNPFVKRIITLYKHMYNSIHFLLNRKRIESKLESPIVCIYNNGFTNDLALSISKILKKPCIYHIREFCDLDFRWNFMVGNKCKQFEMIEKDVTIFIAISNTVKESFQSAHNYEKIKVIYNGIPKVELNKLDSHHDFFNIIISGRLSEEKGHLIVLQAIKKIIESGITNFKLDIYGDGKYKPKIEDYIKENCLEKYVNLKGFVFNVDYQQYDIGIMASRAEAFGRVTVEYMMNGLVTIASDAGANKEIIDDHENGLLFEQNSVNDLVDKIVEVFKDKKLEDKISKNAHETAIKKFTEEEYLNNIYNLLIDSKIIND